MIKLIRGDCLERMKDIPDGSIDAIITDPPYGTTACKWDTVIPLDAMWEQYRRIAKPNAAIVLTASQPFTSALVMSNLKDFKYDWCWRKSRPTGVLNAKRQPLRIKEDVLVFYQKQPAYNPQGVEDCDLLVGTGGTMANVKGNATGKITQTESGKYRQTKTGYPRNVIEFPSMSGTVHPTQKPVALIEYLIRTYTNEGETVLDNCMGSGTTGVACVNTNRNFIGVELDEGYFKIAQDRINQAVVNINKQDSL